MGNYPMVMDSPFGSLDETSQRQVARSLPTLAQILHHWQERLALLPMVRVSAALRAAETRLIRKVQDMS